MDGGVVHPSSGHTVELASQGIEANGRDFRIVPPPPPPPPPPDMELRGLQGIVPPRPGFERMLAFRAVLTGATGPAQLTIELAPGEELVETTMPIASFIGNVLVSQPFSTTRDVGLWLRTPVGTPLGTLFTTSVSIGPLVGDPTPENNTLSNTSVVVGSYDPNDKQVFPNTLTPDEVAGDTLVEYLIRFQNTGTYEAERVLITDTLSSHLRWNTFRYMESSHACEWFLRDGVAHFVFNDIHLPDSTSDERNSHGFVRFAIHPATALQAGESVSNIANIYFDFNDPVITSPCDLAIELPTALSLHDQHRIAVYPVPARTVLNVVLPPEGTWRIAVMAPDGRSLKPWRTATGLVAMDIHDLPSGVYVLRAMDASGASHNRPFMKE